MARIVVVVVVASAEQVHSSLFVFPHRSAGRAEGDAGEASEGESAPSCEL